MMWLGDDKWILKILEYRIRWWKSDENSTSKPNQTIELVS